MMVRYNVTIILVLAEYSIILIVSYRSTTNKVVTSFIFRYDHGGDRLSKNSAKKKRRFFVVGVDIANP